MPIAAVLALGTALAASPLRPPLPVSADATLGALGQSASTLASRGLPAEYMHSHPVPREWVWRGRPGSPYRSVRYTIQDGKIAGLSFRIRHDSGRTARGVPDYLVGWEKKFGESDRQHDRRVPGAARVTETAASWGDGKVVIELRIVHDHRTGDVQDDPELSFRFGALPREVSQEPVGRAVRLDDAVRAIAPGPSGRPVMIVGSKGGPALLAEISSEGGVVTLAELQASASLLYVDRAGTIWTGDAPTRSIRRWDATGAILSEAVIPLVPTRLGPSPSGGIWAAADVPPSVCEIGEDGIIRGRHATGVPARALVSDAAGPTWIVSTETDRALLLGHRAAVLAECAGLPDAPLEAAADPRGGVWIACVTDDLLVRVTPKGIAARIKTPPGPDQVVYDRARRLLLVSCGEDASVAAFSTRGAPRGIWKLSEVPGVGPSDRPSGMALSADGRLWICAEPSHSLFWLRPLLYTAAPP